MKTLKNEAKYTCPHCGGHHFDEPQCLLKGNIPEELKSMVPFIIMCQDCKGTFTTTGINNNGKALAA